MIGSKLDGIKASARRILALAYDFGEEKIINLLSEECNRIFELELSEDFDENGEAYVEQKSEYTNFRYTTKINTKGESVEEWTCVSDDEADDEASHGCLLSRHHC